MALAIPGRIAGGNHTFFSTRPGNGSYYALSHVRYRRVSNEIIKILMSQDGSLSKEIIVQLECLIQSDRIGLAANMSLLVRQRLFLFFLSWGFAYGELINLDGLKFIKFETRLVQVDIAKIVASSIIQIRREFAQLFKEGVLRKVSDTHYVLTKLLDGAWLWLCGNERGSS